MMSPTAVPVAQSAAECPHGLRPGTTVCLRCRQESRLAARQRRIRLITRAGLAFMGVAVAVVLVVGAWNALAPDVSRSEAHANQVTIAPAAREVAPTDAKPAAPPGLSPTIAEGRRELGDSMFAIREGQQVTVHFDTEMLRTRFDWKFEGVVRATLPLVFGPEAGAALDSIPAGTLAGGGHLIDELPRRGIPLRLGDHTLRVWPVTRAGQDGPLVVAYRASASR